MEMDDWIGSLFMLLALAVFFFNKKKVEPPQKQEGSQKTKTGQVEEPWSDFLHTMKADKAKIAVKQPQKAKPRKKEEVFLPVLEVKPLSDHHDALITQPARIKKVVGILPNLRTFILCREILDKPKGLQ